MLGAVEAYNADRKSLRVKASTGYIVYCNPWTDVGTNGITYCPMRAGYASTILKLQGTELEHVTVYLDKPFVPAVAYTAMGRVKSGYDRLIGGVVDKHHFAFAP